MGRNTNNFNATRRIRAKKQNKSIKTAGYIHPFIPA